MKGGRAERHFYIFFSIYFWSYLSSVFPATLPYHDFTVNDLSSLSHTALGWGNIGVVCRGSSSVSVNSVVESFGGNENAIGTIAHELGMAIQWHQDSLTY